jgi:hypothetical protein
MSVTSPRYLTTPLPSSVSAYGFVVLDDKNDGQLVQDDPLTPTYYGATSTVALNVGR